MNDWRTYCNGTIIVGITVLMLGCLPKQTITTETFLLRQQPVKKNITKSPNAKTIYLEKIQTVAPFNSLHFIFKLKPARYQLDYYHRFLSSPSQQLMTLFTTQLNNLTDIKLTTSRHEAKYILNIKLNKFYVDDIPNSEKAIIDLNIKLNLQTSPQKILWWHNYYYAIPIKNYNAGAENIVLAWDKGIQNILKMSAMAITDKLEQNQTAHSDDD